MTDNVDADVLILAAGFGKRLGELTALKPKPLVEIGGKAVIDWNLELVSSSGFKKTFINLHYKSELIREHVGDGSKWGLEVEYIEEPVILGTGGAIKNIENRLTKSLLVTLNSDVVLGRDFSLNDALACHNHNEANPLVTLVLRPNSNGCDFSEIGVDSSGRVCRFLGATQPCDSLTSGLMYTGVQVISPDVLSYMPEPGTFFGITSDTYVKIIENSEYIGSFIYDGYFNDIGTPERLAAARCEVQEIFDIP